jgi:putative spermidine/putrescine transport system permease protein
MLSRDASTPATAPAFRSRRLRTMPARLALYVLCGLICLFLIGPIAVIVPLSFNDGSYFTLPIEKFSLRWYDSFLGDPQWRLALRNSIFIGVLTTIFATVLGTAATLGLGKLRGRIRAFLFGIFLAPLVVPVVVSAVGFFYFFARIRLVGTFTGIVIAHVVLAIPFVVSAVAASLAKFDRDLERAGLSLGASPFRVFLKVILPAIGPGVVSGAIFAFITSWDEVVTVIFIASPPEFTLPRKMWNGIRENVNPTLLAVAVVLTVVSIALIGLTGWLRRSRDKRTA